MNRRTLLAQAVLALAASTIAEPGPAAVPDGLSDHAWRSGRSFGCAVRGNVLLSQPSLRAAIAREADTIVPETELKWKQNEPAGGRETYAGAEAIASAGEFRGLALRGHTAVWHRSIPDWALRQFEAGRGADLVLRRVRGVVAHFRDRIVEWDVVNEAIEPEDGLAHGMRNSPIGKAGGRGLIADCFAAAHDADPKARLYYNEYGVEYASPDEDARRVAVLELLSFLKARGAPVHGLGIQGHLTVGNRFREKVFRSFLADVASLGLEIRITELDVSDRRLDADIQTRDNAVADAARQFVGVALDEPAVAGIVTWGLADPSSWLDTDRPRPDGLVQRTLPLDGQLRRKPLWQALADGFDHAPRRA